MPQHGHTWDRYNYLLTLKLRGVLAPKSSISISYAYPTRRLCSKIVEIPSSRVRCNFLHIQTFYMLACSILGAPKCSTCAMNVFESRHIFFSNISRRRTCCENDLPAELTKDLGEKTKRLRFPPQRGRQIHEKPANPWKSSIFQEPTTPSVFVSSSSCRLRRPIQIFRHFEFSDFGD